MQRTLPLHSKKVPPFWSGHLGCMRQLSVPPRSSYPMLTLWGPRCPRQTVLWMFSRSKTRQPKWTALPLPHHLKGFAVLHTTPTNIKVLTVGSAGPPTKVSPRRRPKATYKVNNPSSLTLKRGKKAPLRNAVSYRSTTTLPCVCAESFTNSVFALRLEGESALFAHVSGVPQASS